MSRKLIGSLPFLSDAEQPAKVESVGAEPANGQKDTESEAVKIRALNASKEKSEVSLRAAGGEIWQDPTLNDWDPTDYRIFVGDLAKEVADSHLQNAFSQYPSLTRVRVIRERHTGRSKGYGFIAFSKQEDYARAMREMQGKFIASRPIKLKRSNWKDRNVEEGDQVKELKSVGFKVKKARK